MPEIMFLYYRTQFVEWTIDWALENIAKQIGFQYNHVFINDARLDVEYSENYTIAFMFFDSSRNDNHFKEFKEKRPNSKIVQLGGDMHYFDLRGLNYKYIDIHLDPIQKVANDIQQISGKPTEHWWWSISESMISELNSIRDDSLEEEKERDLICLCNFTPGMYERNVLFENIKRRGMSLAFNKKLFNIPDIYREYNKSKAALGTTTSCIEGLPHRSMKGFRDWIAPFCDTVLIYDDYIDIVNNLKYLVPIYRYQDVDNIYEIIQLLDRDNDLYKDLIQRQKKWALEHTIDKQFKSILERHNFI